MHETCSVVGAASWRTGSRSPWVRARGGWPAPPAATSTACSGCRKTQLASSCRRPPGANTSARQDHSLGKRWPLVHERKRGTRSARHEE